MLHHYPEANRTLAAHQTDALDRTRQPIATQPSLRAHIGGLSTRPIQEDPDSSVTTHLSAGSGLLYSAYLRMHRRFTLKITPERLLRRHGIPKTWRFGSLECRRGRGLIFKRGQRTLATGQTSGPLMSPSTVRRVTQPCITKRDTIQHRMRDG